MHEQLIILTREDCHKSLPGFYEIVADKLSIPYNDDDIRFDCRHIHVTGDVFKEINNKMMEDGLLGSDRTAIWANYGPKADINVLNCYNEPFFAAKVENGFIIFSEGD